jgi:hypothetical protein
MGFDLIRPIPGKQAPWGSLMGEGLPTEPCPATVRRPCRTGWPIVREGNGSLT